MNERREMLAAEKAFSITQVLPAKEALQIPSYRIKYGKYAVRALQRGDNNPLCSRCRVTGKPEVIPQCL
jgi:hypothetical protein